MAKVRNLKKIIQISYDKQTSHIGSCLSCLDIIEEAFDQHKNPLVVVSKGHAALAYYVVLNDMGYISNEELNTYCDKLGTNLYGHITRNLENGTLFTAGSLGHGLPQAAGYAFVNKSRQVVCIMGDGELDEGTTYETLEMISKLDIKNLSVIIDRNRFKGFSEQHISDDLIRYLKSFKFLEIRETIKGGTLKCISDLELMSHYVKLDKLLYEKAMEEIECLEK